VRCSAGYSAYEIEGTEVEKCTPLIIGPLICLGALRVERSLEQTKGKLRFKSPKTKHGRRTITLPPGCMFGAGPIRGPHQGEALSTTRIP
jgi:hypothetical protein